MSVLTMDMMRDAIGKVNNIYTGPRILEDKNLFKIHYKVKGIPSGHKPNSNRPYYRNVKIIEYPIYYIKASGAILTHPIMAAKIRSRVTYSTGNIYYASEMRVTERVW